MIALLPLNPCEGHGSEYLRPNKEALVLLGTRRNVLGDPYGALVVS